MSYAANRADPRPAIAVAVLALAVAGAALHDVVEFGLPSVQNTLFIAAVAPGLTLVWWWQRSNAIAVVLLAFTAFVFLGAGTSVLPLAVWPWDPEQSIAHYAVHTAWALITVPMLVFAYRLREFSSKPSTIGHVHAAQRDREVSR